jgi:hypothetical protein
VPYRERADEVVPVYQRQKVLFFEVLLTGDSGPDGWIDLAVFQEPPIPLRR